MIHSLRGGTAGASSHARRWPLFGALATLAALFASLAWLRSERLQTVAALLARPALQVESMEGWLWPTRMTNVAWQPTRNLSVRVARIELGHFPGQRTPSAHGVVLQASAPLETAWHEVRSLTIPADLKVMDARLEYTETSGTKLSAEGVAFQPGLERDHLHAQSLSAFGTTFRDVHLWASRPSTALEIRLTNDSNDAKAPKLNVTRSPGQGVEWALDIPSEPFAERASRMGLRLDETWQAAVFVGVGSLIVPDSPASAARANFRFTIDNWHRPSWPEAALLTGRSGAVALRFAPGHGATHAITRVEVAAGLFSLLGTGQLTFGEQNSLTFDAQGELGCARLLAHLPASRHRDRVQAYISEQGEDAANIASVRLELSVVAEAPSPRPLRFRWHLHAGCGLAEMTEAP